MGYSYLGIPVGATIMTLQSVLFAVMPELAAAETRARPPLRPIRASEPALVSVFLAIAAVVVLGFGMPVSFAMGTLSAFFISSRSGEFSRALYDPAKALYRDGLVPAAGHPFFVLAAR